MSAVLILALVASVGAQCLLALETRPERMPCCLGVSQDCHSAAVSEVCCRIEDAEQAPPLAQFRPPALVAIDHAIPALARVRDGAAAGMIVEALAGIAVSPPKYILLASLLI